MKESSSTWFLRYRLYVHLLYESLILPCSLFPRSPGAKSTLRYFFVFWLPASARYRWKGYPFNWHVGKNLCERIEFRMKITHSTYNDICIANRRNKKKPADFLGKSQWNRVSFEQIQACSEEIWLSWKLSSLLCAKEERNQIFMVKKIMTFSPTAENQAIWSMKHTAQFMLRLLMEKYWLSNWRDSLRHFAHKGCCCATLEHELEIFKSLAAMLIEKEKPNERLLAVMMRNAKWIFSQLHVNAS